MKSVTKSEPFHIQAYTQIKNEILNCRLKGGEKVTEMLLAHKLNISRSPIREAMRMLERDKLLIATPNGMVVNPLPLHELKEIYECRIMLESFAARLTAERISEDNMDELERCIEQAEEAGKNGDTDSIFQANTHFHERIIALCGNSHLLDLNELNRGLTILSRSKELRELQGYKRSEDFTSEHRAILAAFRQHDAELAESTMRKHIANDLLFYTSKAISAEPSLA